MRRTVAFLFLVLVVFGSWCAAARADGGLVRLSEQHGRFRITVFTTPTPLRAGWADLSVFVQDAATGAPAENVEVTIGVAPAGQPELATAYPATREAATNKLFRAAQFELAHAGKWQISVAVAGPLGNAETRFEAEAAGPSASGSDLSFWIGWPLLPVFFFGIHQYLVRRRGTLTPRAELPKLLEMDR